MSGGLTPAERRTLAAAMDRILPGGPDGAGAADANAAGYAGWITCRPHFAAAMPCLRTGLVLLDSLAAARFGLAFADCDPAERDDVLGRMRAVPHPTVSRAFVMLVRLTLNGVFASPAYGGNARGAGWEFAGFAPHPFTWPGAPSVEASDESDGSKASDASNRTDGREACRDRDSLAPARAAAWLGSGQ
jgi:hypothetical protein